MVDFVKLIANKNVTACQLLITDLKKNLPIESASWEQPLVSIVKGIEHNYHHETLLAILQELPAKINEVLVLRLVSSNDFKSSYLKTLVTHINKLHSVDKVPSVALINRVLTAPRLLADQPEIMALILKLNAKEQGVLLTQLRNQADHCLANEHEKTHPHQKKLNQIFNDNYQQLLLFLTRHVSKTVRTLQIALSEDPILANLLLSKSLETNPDKTVQKKLILNLFKGSKNYDWTDPIFNRMVHSTLLTLFAALSVEELKYIFNRYVGISIQQHHSITHIIQFLDDLYATTKNIQLIIYCLEAADDADHNLTINFLTHSKTDDRLLRQQCLKKIDGKRLMIFCGHIMALGQVGDYSNQELFTDCISVFCDHLRNHAHPQELFNQLASHIVFLPISEQQIAIATTISRLLTPEQKSLWLYALNQAYKSTKPLVGHCLQFIKEHPDKFQFILPLLKNFPNEDLLTLYLSMVTKKLDKTAFYCFKELFKDVTRQPQLFYILSRTPAINHDLLNTFISTLNDQSLLTLIDLFLSRISENSEFKTALNHVLVIFCQRLYSDQNPKGPIRQWENKTFTGKLVHSLLDSPECVCLLSVTYSTIYSWVNWTSPALALKHRIDAVLNCFELEEDRIKQIALTWLGYFHAHPEQLHPLFNSLHSSESNRTSIGNKNLLGIKQACWELIIKPGVSYKEEDFLKLLYAPKPEFFYPVLSVLVQTDFLAKDPYLGSLRLAITLSALPKTMNVDVLIPLLTHSIHTPTFVNWDKAVKWLKEREPREQLDFAKKLIDRVCSSNNNPILSQQIHHVITQHPSFNILLPQLDPVHWYWLLQYSNQDQLIKQASPWLDLIIQKHEARSLNLGKMLSLLPQNACLIDSLLKKPAFANPGIFAKAFTQLAAERDCTVQLLSLHQFISEQDKAWIDQFIKNTINQIIAINLNTTAINILNKLIVNNAATFSSQIIEDNNLIINYLKLLNTLIEQSDNRKQSSELQQLMLILLTTFINRDSQWNKLILSDAAFTQTGLTWLHNTDIKTMDHLINEHPLTYLLIETPSTYLDPQLTTDPLFQKWLHTLLSTPPLKLKRDQFYCLFDLLLPENKVLLAKHILVKMQRPVAQTQSFEILANTIKPIELFKLFENQVNPDLTMRGLFAHKEGLKDLSAIQRNKLFNSINSSDQLLELLDNQTSFESRFNFIKALFQIYGHDAKTLSQKLGEWLITPEAIAALTNFTIEKEHHQFLDEVFKEKPYYQDYLNDYLYYPTLNMPLNESSYLYCLARENLLNTATKKSCNTQFIKQLPPEDVFSVVKKQFYLNKNIKTLHQVAHLDSQNYKRLQNILLQYISKLITTGHFSVPTLYDFFRVDTTIAPLGQSKLSDEEATLLIKTPALHKEWLAHYELEPEKRFTDVLSLVLKEGKLPQNEQTNKWIFQFPLFSSLSAQLDETVLDNYLTSIKSSELSTLIHSFFEQEHSCREVHELLPTIKPTEPLTEFIKQLLNKSSSLLTQLRTVTESLNLVVLNDLICFAVSIKELGLDEKQISALFLSTAINGHPEIDWLKMDFRLMHERLECVSSRLNQLAYLGFSHHLDTNNAERLIHLSHKNLAHVSPQILLKCLNSYSSIFSKTDDSPNLFLRTLNEVLCKPEAAKEITPFLDVNLINQIVAAAIKNPDHSSSLLEKFINSSWGDVCMQQLQIELNRLIKQKTAPQPTNLSQLSREQMEGFPAAELAKILSIQRLLFFGKPIAELTSFATWPDIHDSGRERQFFCADASLYMVLMNLEKISGKPLTNSTLWLVRHSDEHIKNYEDSIEAFNSEKEVHYPAAHYYWLCWKAFVKSITHKDITTTLTYGLINWLSKLDDRQLQTSPDLNRLLDEVTRQQLLATTLKYVLASSNPGLLNINQVAWLCKNSLTAALKDTTLYPLIINLSSWSWLENYMQNSTPHNFELLKAAMGNKLYLKTINENEKNQLGFLSTLETNKFTYQQILELIKTVHDEQVRSLLIVHLLSQEAYLSSLKAESVISRLTNNQIHTPSRLNALVHQLDIKILSETLINKLPPETAVTILCSIPHFHLLKEHQIESLLGQYPQPEVISYWLNHYSTMPNAHFTLAHLIKLVDAHVVLVLSKMAGIKKETIITSMIEHLELFRPNMKILQEQNEENRLILAIRLFLNGHQHKAYISYINLLTNKLLSNDHQFSLETIQLLITLNGKQEFTELNNKTAYLTNHYLRAKAQAGETALFYHLGRVNNDTMTQLIHLIPDIPKKNTVTGFFTHLLGVQPEITNAQASATIIPENSLVEKLSSNKKHITSFDYFLIHFKGDSTKISMAINDYLAFFAREGCTDSRRRSVHQICDLMLRPELEPAIKEVIFTSLLGYPDLYDKYISFKLFLFDAKRTIQHFGLKGGDNNYKQVMTLCTGALKKLNSSEHKEIVNIATTAKAEAELELSFNEERGFFANLFRRLKRCWISGWTGFFSPNLPIYVAPAASTTTVQDLNASANTDQHTQILPYKSEPDLHTLLKEMPSSLTREKLDELIKAISLFSLKANSINEIEIRQKLHIFFHQLLDDSKDNKKLDEWLIQNQQPFIANRFCLLELILVKGTRTEVNSLLKQINEDPPHLQRITAELTCLLPEQQDEQSEEHVLPPIIAPNILETTLETTSELVNNAWNWTKGFFKPASKPSTTSPSQLSGAYIPNLDARRVL